MLRTIQRLSGLSVDRAEAPGRYHDGGGLYLQVGPSGTKSWVFRYFFAGRRPEMGLGPYPDVSLAAARRAAQDARALVRAGADPISNRDAERARLRLETARRFSFKEVAELYIQGLEHHWRNGKHRQQWRSTLDTYAYPVLGAKPIAAVDTELVKRVLKPIWNTKRETASRLRGRLERILGWATAEGWRTGDNPARWVGHLKTSFEREGKSPEVKHHAALPIDALPAVYRRLRDSEGMAALAVRFVILTAARASEVAGARWSEIDLDKKTWTVPAGRMKAGREHRVPLSTEAIAILKERDKVRLGDLVFPGWKTGKPLSLASLSKALRVADDSGATVHGFRSTFRDWASERANATREVAEMALAHAIKDKVEAAYRRGDLMDRRAPLMERWATFATVERPSAEVIILATVGVADQVAA